MKNLPIRRREFLIASAVTALSPAINKASALEDTSRSAVDTGYRGIWFTLGQPSQHGDKYSGGLGTYTANHVPIAIYSKTADKTFFVYGGAKEGKRHLLAMASHYDHRTGLVPRPTIVHDKNGVDDPHDNPSLAIDDDGFIWVFVSGRATVRPGFIYRSKQPYSTADFELITKRTFTYPQAWWTKDEGFLFTFTKYTSGRELYFSRSKDGKNWTDDQKLAGIGGHYQTSQFRSGRIITAFNRHPGGSVDKRTDLYFIQSDDLGATWKNIQGEAVSLPLNSPENSCLVKNYSTDKRLVYIQDIDLDASGLPVIYFTSSLDHRPGPEGSPRWLTTAQWRGDRWDFTEFAQSNHNYSTGSIYLPRDNSMPWRITAPTGTGPQPVGSGGEVAIWESSDLGKSWKKMRDVTGTSQLNHNYVRRVMNNHSDFASFWADGNPDSFSKSTLYFANEDGSQVKQLPYDMASEFAEPTQVSSRR